MLKHWSPLTTASLIEALSVRSVAFRLPPARPADVSRSPSVAERLVKARATEEVAKILNERAPDDRTALPTSCPRR
jgi:hypothetical protein